MDPSAQSAPNPMEQQLTNSSQLGGGANGDHSKINGDQVIVNPLSNQLRDQQQAQMAAQIAATNRAQAMLNAQTKQQVQQMQQGPAKSPVSPATNQNPALQQQAKPLAQNNPNPAPNPSSNQATAPQTPVSQQQPAQQQQIQNPVQQQQAQPVQLPQTQAGGGANLQNGNVTPVGQVSQQPTPNNMGMQSPASQQPTQPAQNQQMAQPASGNFQNPIAQNQMQSQPGAIPGTIQNPVSQQQPAQQQQIQNPVQQQQVQPMQQGQQMSGGSIVQNQQSIPQTQPVQFAQGVPMQGQGNFPGTIQNPAQQNSTQPVSFQNQQAMPQTQPVTFQTFAPQQQSPNGQQDPNAAQQQSDANQENGNSLSVQQAIQDTFIPVSQLISSNHDPIQDLHHTVSSSNVPDELRVILNDRIKRLGLIKEGAGLSSMYILELESTTRYINACVGLPWVEKTEDTLDLAKAKEILDKHHYGLDLLKNRMLEFIASIMLNLKNNGPDFASRSPILCFVGLAGTGKTTFAKSMAEALGRKFERIPFGGMADSRALRGQSRYFPDAEPGAFLKSLARAKSKNPVLLLDEVDRVTETARADIMGVLIEALDPEQNAQFTDHYIDYPFSLQNCLFVATSNNISTIATAVLDRMEIIQMPNYNDNEKKVIGRDYVLPKVRSQMGLREDQLIIDEAVWDAIIRPLGYDPGVRALDRIIGMICRRAARMIVAGESETVRVTINNMKPFVQDF